MSEHRYKRTATGIAVARARISMAEPVRLARESQSDSASEWRRFHGQVSRPATLTVLPDSARNCTMILVVVLRITSRTLAVSG